MASTRWISALCAGSSKDTNLKKDLMAVRRRLRVFAAGAAVYFEIGEERADERCIQIGKRQGPWDFRSRTCANMNSSRNVSL